MRRITSKEETAKKAKRNNLILGGFLILIMIGSVFGIIVGSLGNSTESDKINYNGHEFVNSNGLWTTKIGNYEFAFAYNPEQVEKIPSSVNSLEKYSGKTLYFSSDNSNALIEIYRNMEQFVGRFQEACLNETKCEENLPIKDCSNNFIIIREFNSSNILQSENCVFIEGNYENLTAITDEFLFKILNIEDNID
jgi:hypothetical protein